MRTMHAWSCLPLILCMALSGCGGQKLGEAYKKMEPVPADKTLIHIYRIPAFAGGIYPVFILANGKEITALPEGGYYPLLADPGEVEISTKLSIGRGDSLTLDAQKGQTAYLEVQIRTGMFSGQAGISKVLKDRGEEWLLQMRRAPETTKQ